MTVFIRHHWSPMTLRRLGTVIVLALAAAVLGLVAAGTGRALAGGLAALAAVFGLALAAHADRYESTMDMVARGSEWALALAPGLLIVYFGFNGGGYFPGADAFAAVVLALVLGLRIWLAPEPLAGYGPLAAIAAGFLLLFGLWTLLSGAWSHAPGRAIVEADRVLLYLLALLLFASATRTTERMRLVLRSVVAGAVIVCGIGLITRVAPDVWPIRPDIQQGRLSYPLTYWNAFGLLAALGLVLSAHLTCSEREPRLWRIAGAAAMPVLASALFFTFSRGAIAVAILGLVAYVLLARPRGLLGGLIAAGPATAIALVSAYGADLLSSDNPTTSAAAAQGHHVALVVALCAAGAAVVRTIALPLDGLMERVHLPSAPEWRWVPRAAWAVGAVAVAVAFVALNGPDRVSNSYHHFVEGNAVVMTGDLRARLGDVGNNRRIDQWKVALDGYREDRFKGLGAGTYVNIWNRRRPVTFAIQDAHSLYVEVLAELGVVGLVLLVVPLALMAFALARGLWRSRDRYVYAGLLAALLAWLVRAALDWDWEMPAITIWVFCAGGAALAVSRRSQRRPLRLAGLPRLGLALLCLAVALVPAAVAVAQYRLEKARTALEAGDCRTAESEARGALDVIGFMAEPHQVLAYCAVRAGDLARAQIEAGVAVRRDPQNWLYRYDSALIAAAGGGDPEPAARSAALLNPRDPEARAAPSVLVGPGARQRALNVLETR
jgi:O-antigen ligase